MRTLQSVIALGAMTGILCVSSVAIAADEAAQPPQKQASGMNSLRVVRDAATGELRAPTSEELKALLAAQEAASRTSALSRSTTATAPQILPAQKSVVRHANGMMSMRLPQESLSAIRLATDAQGKSRIVHDDPVPRTQPQAQEK